MHRHLRTGFPNILDLDLTHVRWCKSYILSTFILNMLQTPQGQENPMEEGSRLSLRRRLGQNPQKRRTIRHLAELYLLSPITTMMKSLSLTLTTLVDTFVACPGKTMLNWSRASPLEHIRLQVVTLAIFRLAVLVLQMRPTFKALQSRPSLKRRRRGSN